MESKTCKVPDCLSPTIHLRGLCRSCYIYAATLVFHRVSTWEQMEAVGCVDPVQGQIQSPKRPIRTDWFSRATGWTPDGLADELRKRIAEYEIHRRHTAKKSKRGTNFK